MSQSGSLNPPCLRLDLKRVFPNKEQIASIRVTLKLTSRLSHGEGKNTPTVSTTLDVASRGLRRRLWCSLSHRLRPCSQGCVHPLGNPRFSWTNPRVSYLSRPPWSCLMLVQGGPSLAVVFPRSWALEGLSHCWHLQIEWAMDPKKVQPVGWCSKPWVRVTQSCPILWPHGL